jgi:uncharacterized protein (DUF2252 family)
MQALTLAGALIESFLRPLFGQTVSMSTQTAFDPVVISGRKILCAVKGAKQYRHLAEEVGKAHARQMDAATRRDFASSFNQRKSARLNAPSWLWSSVVELASCHEAAYLEHCRLYALESSSDFVDRAS